MSKKKVKKQAKKVVRLAAKKKKERGRMFTQAELDDRMAKKEQLLKDQYEEQRNKDLFGNNADFGVGQPEQEQTEEEIQEEVLEENKVDIFEYVEKNFTCKGAHCRYVIEKDGQFCDEVPHPFSWLKVKTKYGGGHFMIKAKEVRTRRIVKQQTLNVLETEDFNSLDAEPEVPAVQQPLYQQQVPSIGPEWLRTIGDLFAQKDGRKDREEREDKRSADNNLNLMVELNRSQSGSTEKMFLALQQSQMDSQKSNFDMIHKVTEMQNKSLVESRQETNRLIEAMSKSNEKPLSPLEMLTMFREAEDRGADKMEKMFEMIEARAADKESDDNDSGTTIDRLLTMVTPLVKGAIQAPQQQLQPPRPPQVSRQVLQNSGVSKQRPPARQQPVSSTPSASDFFKVPTAQPPVVQAPVRQSQPVAQQQPLKQEPLRQEPLKQEPKNNQLWKQKWFLHNKQRKSQQCLKTLPPCRLKLLRLQSLLSD